MPRIIKLTETESKLVVARGGEEVGMTING